MQSGKNLTTISLGHFKNNVDRIIIASYNKVRNLQSIKERKVKTMIKFLISPAHKKYKDLLFRISNLETAVNCLIESPKYVESLEVGFNGQAHRKVIFQELLSLFDFDAILETGTWIGNTTGYMAKISNLPIYTCELDKLLHSLAKMRLKDVPNIILELSDSREFLKKMKRTDIVKKRVFIYLDAHCNDDLPLQKELEIICSNWRDFVIMIDDFQVPGDVGYGYDNYGKKKILSLDMFSRTFSKHDLISFFPTLPSAEETGLKRGCVVLTRNGEWSEKLSRLQSLTKSGF